MTTTSPVSAMDAAADGLPAETQVELNTPFHKAKWECFLTTFPITEPVEKLFFMFGTDVDQRLGWFHCKGVWKVYIINLLFCLI